MKKPKSTRADGQATREAILDAAADEFAAKGYELASVRAICAKAGANVALANRYFGSKESLYRLVAKRLFGDLGAPLAKLADTVTDEASWRAAVRTWIDDFLFLPRLRRLVVHAHSARAVRAAARTRGFCYNPR